MRTCLLALLVAAGPAYGQPFARQAVSPAPPSVAPALVVLRTLGALGGELGVAVGATLVLYGREDNVPPVLFLLIPIGGAAAGATLVGHAFGTPGTFTGAVVGGALGSLPGIVVLAASANHPDLETTGALLFVGGAAVGAAVGYGSPRLSLGLARLPGGVAPALHARF